MIAKKLQIKICRFNQKITIKIRFFAHFSNPPVVQGCQAGPAGPWAPAGTWCNRSMASCRNKVAQRQRHLSGPVFRPVPGRHPVQGHLALRQVQVDRCCVRRTGTGLADRWTPEKHVSGLI